MLHPKTAVSLQIYIVNLICCLLLFFSSAGVEAKITYSMGGDIYVSNDDVSTKRNLTKNPMHDDFQSRWSPDGSRIVFTRMMDRSDPQHSTEVFIMNADGTDQQRLTNNDVSDEEPCWSPDGKNIAFRSEISGTAQVYILELATRKLTQLTGKDEGENDKGSLAPDWSPDGTAIVYEKFVKSPFAFSHKNIYVMDATGENQHPLLPDPTDDINAVIMRFQPRWSADGRSILFDECTRLGVARSKCKLTIMRLGQRPWIVEGIYDKLGENVLIGGTACWMNNDREILLSLRLIDKSRTNYDLYRYEINKQHLTRLTWGPEVEGYPDWIEGALSVSPSEKKTEKWGNLKK